MINRYALAVAFLAAGIGIGASLASLLPTDKATVESSTVLFEAAEDAIMAVSWSTPEMRMTAQRSKAGTAFALQMTFVDGRAMQQCATDSMLAGRLPALSKLVALRQIDVNNLGSEYPVMLGVLDIRTSVLGEPMAPMIVRTNQNRSEVVVVYDGFAAQLTMPATTLSSLGAGCQSFSGR